MRMIDANGVEETWRNHGRDIGGSQVVVYDGEDSPRKQEIGFSCCVARAAVVCRG